MSPATPASMRRYGGLLAACAALVVCFIQPIVRLVGFIFTSEFNSYIILVPFITLYLLWTRSTPPPSASSPDRRLSLVLCLVGLAALACFWATGFLSIGLLREDALAIQMLAFVVILLGTCAFFLPKDELRALAFPLGFLILIVPLPSFLRTAIEQSLQVGSALAAHWMFEVAGVPVYYRDLTFQFPDITLRVAPECSGIQSTVALFITSLLAGHIFLRTGWRRWALTIAVLPLAVLRNGFRIFTIGELCVHMGPQMIHSYIHRKGGPIFFALSLIPFLLFLFFLIRSERPRQGARKST